MLSIRNIGSVKTLLILLMGLLLPFSGLSQGCLPNGITFNTQSQIDSFSINHPGCTEIEGYVKIRGDDITNLNGLNALTSIVDALTVGDYYGGNPALTSLIGLDNLISIGGSLSVENNDALISLAGLDNVTSIGGPVLIKYNPLLTTIVNLSNVISIGGSIFIEDASLTNLTGLNNLISIEGALSLSNINTLTSLTGLENVTTIGGPLVIEETSLTTLTELNSVNNIGEELWIGYNNALTSLTGLDNINIGPTTILCILVNSSLATCEVQSICDYLSGPHGYTDIEFNAPGCNSQEEVEEACGIIGVPEIDSKAKLSISPNPASNHITIETPAQSQLSILNLNGQELLKQTITEPKTVINISSLPNGIYFVRLTGKEIVGVGKFIKQ
ncbi:T9SS type A sorting domain-containing protein [bacterium]|nr:T9SS type A sorting domain-containing protein [bacterium]